MPHPIVERGDQELDVVIGHLLRVGVTLSAVVVLLGGAVFLARHGLAAPHYGVFRGQPTDLRSVSGIVADLPSLRGRAIIQGGLLLLVATPILRVAFSIIAFARERDATYVAVTIVVLGALLYGLLGRHP